MTRNTTDHFQPTLDEDSAVSDLRLQSSSESQQQNPFETTNISLKAFRKRTPPRSPYNLVQEILFHEPWRLLVATIFLFLYSSVLTSRLHSGHRDLQWTSHDAVTLSCSSDEYLSKSWQYPIELHGTDRYMERGANTGICVFVMQVTPDDDKLNDYHTWLRKNQEQ
uniref:Uncharacterized protein n=1 Tax=Cyprinus carpio TaxID=7962 RepID=A0A8C1UB53_CYPCA